MKRAISDIYDIHVPVIYGSLALPGRGGRSRGDVPMIRKTIFNFAITTALGAAIALAPVVASARGGGGGAHGGGGHGGGMGGGHGGSMGGHGMGGRGFGMGGHRGIGTGGGRGFSMSGGHGFGIGAGRGFVAGRAFYGGGNFHVGRLHHRGFRSFAFGGPIYGYGYSCWEWYPTVYGYVRTWVC
jgi:hypothetical protein